MSLSTKVEDRSQRLEALLQVPAFACFSSNLAWASIAVMKRSSVQTLETRCNPTRWKDAAYSLENSSPISGISAIHHKPLFMASSNKMGRDGGNFRDHWFPCSWDFVPHNRSTLAWVAFLCKVPKPKPPPSPSVRLWPNQPKAQYYV
jgi:hypothetical protein